MLGPGEPPSPPTGNSEKVLPTVPCLEMYGSGKSGSLGLKPACKKQV